MNFLDVNSIILLIELSFFLLNEIDFLGVITYWYIHFCLWYLSLFHYYLLSIIIVVQLLSHIQPSATPWTVARQASLSFTIS